MIKISYGAMFAFICLVWVSVRLRVYGKTKKLSLKREAQLMLVFICVVVVARFTFFPFSKVDGRIQPLVFDAAKAFPPRINLLPFVYLFDYPVFREAMLNLIGNTAMFIPLGIVWPSVFRELDSHKRAIYAGVGVSLFIEILQLPFFDRVSDIDDLILNSIGYLLGYGTYLLAGKIKAVMPRTKGRGSQE